ncbi:MAG: MFS transporter [Clostridiales bacterium]|nr:MFS transporter [Clostridiales bacterium]
MIRKKDLSPSATRLIMQSVYLLYWGTNFITGQYSAVFLRGFPFLSDFLVGMTISCGSLISTAAQMFWGNIADHAKTKNRILIITIMGVITGLFLLITPNHSSLLTLFPTTLFLYFFLTIPGVMVDTIIVENVQMTGVPFGRIRVFASAGAAAGALMIFLLSLRITIVPSSTFQVAIACAGLALFPVMFLPETKGHAYKQKKDKAKANYKIVLKNPRMILLLCFLLLIFTGTQATNLFLSVHYSSAEGLNAGLGSYGLFFAFCIGCEALVMTLGNRLWQSMNIYHVFTLTGFAAFGRSFIVYLAPNIYVLCLLAIFQALLFAPLWTRLSPYVNSIVPKEARATGQAIWNVIVAGVAPMIGSALGGTIAEIFGVRNVFGVASAICLVSSVVFFFLFNRQKRYDLLHPIIPDED